MNDQIKPLNASRIAVVEGKWYPTQKTGRNTSVRELFDLLCGLNYGDSQSYHYEMFNDSHAFQEIAGRLVKLNGIHYIYVASHGSDDGVHGSNGELVPLKKIIKSVSPNDKNGDQERGKLHGIYFGCCLFGQDSTLDELLTKNPKIYWAAGYGKKIDFVKSSALDLIFWQQYLSSQGTPLKRIKETSTWLNKAVPGFIDEMNFRLSCWDGGINKLI